MLHVRTVKRSCHRQLLDEAAFEGRICQKLVHRIRVACDRDRLGPVMRGNDEAPVPSLENLIGPLEAQSRHGHGPFGGVSSHEPCAVNDQSDGVLQAQRPGIVGRRDLADAVTDDACRPDTPGLPQLREAELHGEQNDLIPLGVIQPRCVRIGKQKVADSPIDETIEQLVTMRNCRTEHFLVA